MVSDIPAEDGKIVNLFLTVYMGKSLTFFAVYAHRVRVENPADHSRDHDQEHRQDLRVLIHRFTFSTVHRYFIKR